MLAMLKYATLRSIKKKYAQNVRIKSRRRMMHVRSELYKLPKVDHEGYTYSNQLWTFYHDLGYAIKGTWPKALQQLYLTHLLLHTTRSLMTKLHADAMVAHYAREK